MDEQLKGVMRRVQKLLAIAGDSRANPHEAAAAASQAEKIMRKHSLTHIELLREDFTRRASFESFDVSAVMKRKAGHSPRVVPLWAQGIAIPLARLNDCELRLAENPTLGACIRFFGYAADVQITAWSCDYIFDAVVSAVRAFQKEQPRTKAQSESFRRGFCLIVTRALEHAVAQRDAEMQAVSAGRELVVVKSVALREHFGEFSYGVSKRKSRIDEAYIEGCQRAREFDPLRRAVEGSSASAAPALQ